MALSDIALKRSVTRSERFFPFRCSRLRFNGFSRRSTLFSGLVAVICCHDPDRSSILIKISSRQRLFCKYPLKRAVSHSERFFRFRMVSPWLYRTKRQKAIQGFSVKDPKRINQRNSTRITSGNYAQWLNSEHIVFMCGCPSSE